MVAVEIRKNGGFPQATGNRKPTQHFFYSQPIPSIDQGKARDDQRTLSVNPARLDINQAGAQVG